VKDVAGNAWDLEEVNRILAHLSTVDPPLASNLQTSSKLFLRHDPISSPNILPLQAPGPSDLGTSTEVTGGSAGSPPSSPRSPDSTIVLVIRSGIQSRFQSSRWLFLAPEIALLESEWSGMLDIFSTAKAAYKVFREQYARKLAKNLYAKLLTVLKWPGSGALSTPYIPDIHAAGVAFNYLPGQERPANLVAITRGLIPKVVQLVDFALDPRGPVKGKPYSQPFIVQLTAGKRSARYEKFARTLQVRLPPGEQQAVVYGCYPDPQRLNDFALVHAATSPSASSTLLQKDLPAMLEPDAISLFQAGLISSITPRSTLRLVHAIPKPLYAASFRSPRVSPRRTFGIAVLFEDTIKVHRASTAKIEIQATWTEYADSRNAPWPPTSPAHLQPPLSVTVDLPDLTIAPDESHETLAIKIRHNFPDTKFRRVKYRIQSTTRYRDYFDAALTSKPENITRLSEYSKDLYVLNTAPPDPLVIEYILPTFKWISRGPHGASEYREVRRVSGLRIFMRRPWPSSGEGEALGIILRPSQPTSGPNITGPDDDPPPSYSEIGSDPIRIDAGVSRRYLRLSDFDSLDTEHQVRECLAFDHPLKVIPTVSPAPDASGQIPTVEDRQIDPVADSFTVRQYDVAVFEAQFDRAKGLMFADIDLVARKEYFPFVRFVGARYQRHSAPYAFLSTPTVAEFVQIAPERVATIVRQRVPGNPPSTTKAVFVIRVVGPMHGDRLKGSLLNEVEIAATQSTQEFGDLDQLPLNVALSSIDEGDEKLQVWSAQVDAAQLNAFNALQIREYEVYDAGSGYRRRLVYLATVPLR
jgi:hypothetical protein